MSLHPVFALREMGKQFKSHHAMQISSAGDTIEILGKEVNYGAENSYNVVDWEENSKQGCLCPWLNEKMRRKVLKEKISRKK